MAIVLNEDETLSKFIHAFKLSNKKDAIFISVKSIKNGYYVYKLGLKIKSGLTKV